MRRITQLHWAMVGLWVGVLSVCPAWGETPPAPENVVPGCGAPGTGDCLKANGSPYCENAACCEAVCAVDPYCCLTEWDANCVSVTRDFTTECGAREVLLSAVSRKDHGTAGQFDINLPVNTYADVGIESRSGGPTQVVLTFSGPVDGLNVQASSGSVGAIIHDGAEATVELSGAHSAACLVLAISGSNMAADARVRVRCLTGDARTDGVVNIFDLVTVRNTLNQPVTASNFRMDVTADGAINIFDLVTVRNNLNTRAAVCPGGEMVLIPQGEFQMGDTFNEGDADGRELPLHPVYVSAFYIDRYEVTNDQFAQALNWVYSHGGHIAVSGGVVYQAGSGTSVLYCDTASSSSSSQITWNGSTFGVAQGKKDYPIMSVSWYGSAAFSNWRSAMEGRTPCYDLSTWTCDFDASGYRLPTEAEWEKAARGGVSGRRFPHGNTIKHDYANYYANGSAYTYDTSPYTTWTYHPTFNTGNMPYTSPVGYFAPNGYGLYDMAGNVWEWCHDWYSGTYYSSSPYHNPCGPIGGTYRVLRGGTWSHYADRCRVAKRSNTLPSHRDRNLGFRCAAGTGGN